MKLKEQNIRGRVRKNTPSDQNKQIDQESIRNIKLYEDLTAEDISRRLEELKMEWDIERTLEVNASIFMLTGLVFGKVFNKRWYGLSGVVASFLLQHGIQGWCPPLPLFRAMGIRTRREIDEEIYALKVLRGDFDTISASSEPTEIVENFRR
jgi:hypothetical protein